MVQTICGDYIFGPLLRIKKRTIKNLRKLPHEARSHKQLILHYYGWKHAFKPALRRVLI
jgi:F420-0:gamma-glutamyl ligase-like protein